MDDWKQRVAACGDESLATALTEAIEELFARDLHLLTVNVHENTIAAMLRGYVHPRVGNAPDGNRWDVDFDFNRNGLMVKKVYGVQTVRPDLIVHRRNSDHNLLAVELKKGSSPEPDADDVQNLEAYKKEPWQGGLAYRATPSFFASA
jgi:hypothetical protein